MEDTLKTAEISWSRKETKTLTGESVFTEHVRTLAGRASLNPHRLEELWSALRAALRSELKRRGLWETPPVYLGIYGWESWEASGEKETALEELLAECYSYIFFLRLRSLEAQLKLKENIDGLIFLNIRHFLHERQKEHDPLGSQVFQVLQAAVRAAVAEGDLYVLQGDERIRNHTVLSAYSGGPALEPAREGLAPWWPAGTTSCCPIWSPCAATGRRRWSGGCASVCRSWRERDLQPFASRICSIP